MNRILFTYDLNKEVSAAKRAQLREAIISTFPTRWSRLTTTWIVETSLTAVQVRDWVAQHLDSNDELFVVDITGKAAAWQGFDANADEWLVDVLNR
ncbi:MAG: hypothetical protein WBF95_16615 [Comamonas thiooxydans]